jgi:methanogenic corrinoid protein MtbC1
MLNGALPSEAARTALSQDLTPVAASTEITNLSLHLVTDEIGADNVIALDSPKVVIRSLNRAVSALDAIGCDQIISQAIESHGVIWTWEKVLIPVLIAIGEEWEQTGEGVEQEHLLAESIMSQFRKVLDKVTEPENARPVLLACAPHELHTIPMYAIAAGLAEQNITSRILGARLPAQSLGNAAKKIGPSAILVWSQTKGTADCSIWDAVEPMRPAPVLMCAGPGWQEELPQGVVQNHDFTSTLIALAAASGR